MRVLALDTASTQMVLALADFGEADASATMVASCQVDAPRQANQVLLTQAARLLADAGLEVSDIDAIVVGRGPGSFTGVRIGVATAKGLACGLAAPLYGASTLDAVAWRAWWAGVRGRLGVVADAMRKEVYPVRYALDDAGVTRLEPDTVAKPAQGRAAMGFGGKLSHAYGRWAAQIRGALRGRSVRTCACGALAARWPGSHQRLCTGICDWRCRFGRRCSARARVHATF